MLDDVDFEKLTKGEIIDKDGVKIALSDIGFSKMCEILDKNYNNFLKNCNKFTTFDLLDKQEKLNDSDDVDFIEYTDNNDNYI